MSRELRQDYERALNKQHSRSEARTIRKEVAQARRSPHTAGSRWPFELLQNALDAGPRTGRISVTIRLRCSASRVVFEHDAVPFTCDELAALLSGGSSKPFESDLITGRFGTGFLVTHVLAERTALRGLIEVATGIEQFNLTLDRGGDEDAILQNIESCNEAIEAAAPITDLNGVPSASFEYPIAGDSILTLGLDALHRALPYLYVTRQSLGRVELVTEEDSTEIWTAGEVLRELVEDGYVEHRSLYVEYNGSLLPEIRVFRFITPTPGHS